MIPQQINITVNILCGCHYFCCFAVTAWISLFHSCNESSMTGSIVFFCLVVFVCLYSFLSDFTVNDLVLTVVLCMCTKLTHVLRAIKYIIETLTEYGNDIACTKLSGMQ